MAQIQNRVRNGLYRIQIILAAIIATRVVLYLVTSIRPFDMVDGTWSVADIGLVELSLAEIVQTTVSIIPFVVLTVGSYWLARWVGVRRPGSWTVAGLIASATAFALAYLKPGSSPDIWSEFTMLHFIAWFVLFGVCFAAGAYTGHRTGNWAWRRIATLEHARGE